LYLDDAKDTLSLFFDYLINDCGIETDMAASLFITSGYAGQFERGNPAVIAGMSGPELAEEVIRKTYQVGMSPSKTETSGLSGEYWAGWALAYFQWYSGRTFADIFDRVKLSEIVRMYPVYHEMDISRFVEAMDRKCREPSHEARLKTLRENRGLSQSELAGLSGVNLRSIQMYEQRVNDIDRAQVNTVYKLARVIGCSVEDLLENPMG